MKLATAKIMQGLDKTAIEEIKIPGVVLMENAGAGCVQLIIENYAEAADKGVAIVCGTGNNGGDGFVIARHLWNMNYEVEIYLLGDPEKVKGDAKINLEVINNIGLPIYLVQSEEDALELTADLSGAGLIVDAVFGTGLDREVTGRFGLALDAINSSEAITFAVDMPSGINTDTGMPMGVGVFADMTATFGLAKVGQWLFPGFLHCGTLEVVDISIPPEIVEQAGIFCHLSGSDLFLHLFAPRFTEAHKGDFGHTIIVGGSPGFSGAVAMAGNAAMRAGAGLVTVAAPVGLNDILEVKLTEVMTAPLAQTDSGHLSDEALNPLLELCENKSVVAIGPGMGQAPQSLSLLRELLTKLTIPVVIDADGLNLISQDLSILESASCPIVLTPHPGEMSRLTGLPTTQIQSDRLGIARSFAEKYGVYLALKGGRTIIASPNGDVVINSTGNPGMATGGVGDILTGMIAGYIAQHSDVLDCVIAAVYLHGLAGDRCAEKLGEKGLAATDLLQELPEVMNEFEKIFTSNECEFDQYTEIE